VIAMRVGVLFSGGKDSTYALWKAMGGHEVACLITVVSKNAESYMFHTPNIHVAALQAEAIGLPLIKGLTEGVKEEELADLKKVIMLAREKFKIEGVVTGALASVYQAERIKRICDSLNLGCINPLWGMDQELLLREVVESGFKTIISGVFAYPLDESWLGREIDLAAVNDLAELKRRYQINPAGEGGEIETTVLDAPFFRKKVEVLDYEKKIRRNSGVFLIKKARLADK